MHNSHSQSSLAGIVTRPDPFCPAPASNPLPPLRLVRDEPYETSYDSQYEGVAGFAPALPETSPTGESINERDLAAKDLYYQFNRLREENEHLRAEIRHLRRRDDTVKTTIQRIDEELRLAARLQRDFMPRTLPSHGRVKFNCLFRPASYVSGDIYDVSRVDENHIGFYMADAVGHGMPAALLTMFIKQSLQTKEITANSYRLLKPSETLARLNEAMLDQDLSESTFATAVCGLVNIKTGATMISAAGHPPPLLLPQGGEMQEIQAGGPLLGIFPCQDFEDAAFTLNPGDRLILYTDGVEVAFPATPGTNDKFDADRWRRELLAYRHEDSDTAFRIFAEALDAQPCSLSPADDLTLISLDLTD